MISSLLLPDGFLDRDNATIARKAGYNVYSTKGTALVWRV
jgi:hypothetical protein